jgi:predicted protein tyrosine phosphatase
MPDLSDLWLFEIKPPSMDLDLDVVVVDRFMAEDLARTEPDAMISIWDRGTYPKEKYPWTTAPGILVLEFDDVLRDLPDHGYVAPRPYDVKPALDLAPTLRGRLVVHCAAGISRSSAMAIAVFAARFGPGREHDAVRAMLVAVDRTRLRKWRSGSVHPNRLIIEIADELLDRDGALLVALDEVLAEVDEWRNP